ncbi:MAG: caspase family protein [Moorea sp. SIO3I7]|uniref:caspase family protein n=1 Tax=Moorena sp. SIO3I8 TaxID=2607833 RepID=UPI0013C051C0|nr:caspase family protein [Moorena sp. SIO3I8]NEN98158.1 caspase family protein [Moorena sp. SIO3I7]NEO07529.1 caspase family protein [Moorena sp. SIO3I8]
MPQQFNHGYALLIGVGESRYSRLSLPVTVNDTQAIYAALIDPELCAYPDNNDHIRVLNNKEATRDNILEGLQWLQESAKADPEATIFVYYSGHGLLNKEDNRYYLLQHDIKLTKLAASALSAEVFTEALRQIPAERLLVVIDSCHAAGMATSKDPEEIIREVEKVDIELADEFEDFQRVSPSKGFVEQLKQGKGRVVFTSSRGEEKSWIHPDGLYSIYTNHFLEALQGAANKPGDTDVKVSNVMNHLSKVVPESVRKFYQKQQTPNFDMATEDFVIAKLKGGKGFKGWQEEESEAEEKIKELASVEIKAAGDGAVAAQNSTVIAGADVIGEGIVFGNQNTVENKTMNQNTTDNYTKYNIKINKGENIKIGDKSEDN